MTNRKVTKWLSIKLLLVISLFFAATATEAQNKIQVTSFNRMETDVTARITAPQRDQNGEVCALIRIVTIEKDLMFEPDALGIVSRENKPGEIGCTFLAEHDVFPLCTISSVYSAITSILTLLRKPLSMKWKYK